MSERRAKLAYAFPSVSRLDRRSKLKLKNMREDIKKLLEDLLPLVDLESDFLFSDLDSLGVTTILMTLSAEYGIELEAKDATPKNLKNLDSIVAMVEEKLK